MALRSDSYGTVAEVLPFVRQFLDGETTFNSTTRPTLTEVEAFMDRTSGVLNLALKGQGLGTPITSTANSTGKLACADWVVARAARYVEITHPGQVWSGEPDSRPVLGNLQRQAKEFAVDVALALKYDGATVSKPKHLGLAFTGLDKRSERSDPEDTTREQPKFRRGLFDSEKTSFNSTT